MRRRASVRPEAAALLLQLSEATAWFYPDRTQQHQGVGMAVFIHHRQQHPQARLRQWQQARTWARLIREAEALWHVDVRALRRMGAEELSQLLEEIPPAQRQRINRWLHSYAVATRLQSSRHRSP